MISQVNELIKYYRQYVLPKYGKGDKENEGEGGDKPNGGENQGGGTSQGGDNGGGDNGDEPDQ